LGILLKSEERFNRTLAECVSGMFEKVLSESPAKALLYHVVRPKREEPSLQPQPLPAHA